MKKIIVTASVIWVFLIGVSFFWNYHNFQSEQKEITRKAAVSFFDLVLFTRAWNAGHGGVYVPVSSATLPNPYLDIPMRDLKINDKLTLTKINPAYMTRQLSEIAAKHIGVQFHITSLKPIRPKNQPTKMERAALEAFEKGQKYADAVFTRDGKDYFFFMAPLKTTKYCLPCHAKQGYKEGDIRGGISVTLSFIPKIKLTALLISHVFIGLAGLAGIFYAGNRINRAYKVIQHQAVIDALTGIPNRGSFTDTIVREFKRTQRDNQPLSLIICDVDHFKLYNDTYGHSEGDQCLIAVAKAIKDTLVRPGDFCARYGGEEFVVVLPNTPEDGAVQVANRIRENVLALKIPHEKSPPLHLVSISLGVATAHPYTEAKHEHLIKLADDALYTAKEKGRNQVELAKETA